MGEPPRRFAHYRLLRLLGKGGMGSVYLAYDERREREVALKVLPDDLADDTQFRDRFRREARIAADLTQAEAARAEAEAATSGGGNTLADARTRSLQLTAKARDDAAAATARRIAEVDAGLEAHAEQAANRLSDQRQAALAELDAVAGTATVDLVRRVSGIEISNDEAASAVKKVAA